MSPLAGFGFSIPISLTLTCLWTLLVVASVRPGRPSHPLQFVALASLAFVPLLAGPESVSWRYTLFMLGLGPLLTSVITYGSRRHPSLIARLLAAPTLLASHYQERAPKRIPIKLGLTALGQVIASSLLIFGIQQADLLHAPGWHGLFSRAGAGVALLLVLPNAVVNSITFCCMASGWKVREWHRAPYLSASLGEFWSERWNLLVPRSFSRLILKPLIKRRKPGLAITATFLASAALHFWLGIVTAPLAVTIPFTLYFVFQIPFALAERPLGVRTWPKWAGRMWTYILIIGPSPMLTEWIVLMVSS